MLTSFCTDVDTRRPQDDPFLGLIDRMFDIRVFGNNNRNKIQGPDRRWFLA